MTEIHRGQGRRRRVASVPVRCGVVQLLGVVREGGGAVGQHVRPLRRLLRGAAPDLHFRPRAVPVAPRVHRLREEAGARVARVVVVRVVGGLVHGLDLPRRGAAHHPRPLAVVRELHLGHGADGQRAALVHHAWRRHLAGGGEGSRQVLVRQRPLRLAAPHVDVGGAGRARVRVPRAVRLQVVRAPIEPRRQIPLPKLHPGATPVPLV
mmetsp:Transcript_13982/g.33519  ORF Transcript_13982/g.33519 Transcript_13982/m.33519 type:complete len:208 (+) Transcript_13982:138-761(+)